MSAEMGQNVIVVGVIGLSGVKHDAVTVKHDDLQLLYQFNIPVSDGKSACIPCRFSLSKIPWPKTKDSGIGFHNKDDPTI
jgi:hypothetical protein